MSIYVEIYKFQLPMQTALVTGSAGGTEARLVNMEMIFLSPFATQAKGAAFSSLARRGSQSDSKNVLQYPVNTNGPICGVSSLMRHGSEPLGLA